jgi:hypothetical protein
MSARPLLAALALLLPACRPDTASSPAVTRDSAGISIVENPAPDSSHPRFVVSDTPTVVIGAADGAEEELFTRISGVSRLSSGEIAVAEMRPAEIRVFGPTGEFVRRIGRPGEGPGEFKQLAGLVQGDLGVHTWDWNTRRLSSFSDNGDFLGARQLDWLPKIDTTPMLSSPFPLLMLPEGRLLAAGVRGRFNPPSGNYRDSTGIWIIDSVGAMRQVGSHYREANYVYHTPNGDVWFGNSPFAPRGSMVPSTVGWIQSGGEQFEWQAWTLEGVLSRIIRVQRPVRPVTDAQRTRHMDSLLAEASPEDRDGERTVLEWAEWSTTMPAYDALLRDSEGMTWARIYPYDATMATWDVFDRTGQLVATASTPSTLEVKQIGVDWLLGQGKGEMDEPLVLMYRLTR